MNRSSDRRRPPAHRPSRPGALGAAGAAPSEVRILGGRFKRTPLAVPDWPGLRPTPSRVRETLFNWLGQDLAGWRVLDAFAGSGALGLEAASRGASEVVLNEREPALARALESTARRLGADGVQVTTGDALSAMERWARQQPDGRFDLVLLDPPFDGELFDRALQAAQNCVPEGGWIYLEAPRAFGPAASDSGTVSPLPAGLSVHRQGRAGAVHFHLLRRGAPSAPPLA